MEALSGKAGVKELPGPGCDELPGVELLFVGVDRVFGYAARAVRPLHRLRD